MDTTTTPLLFSLTQSISFSANLADLALSKNPIRIPFLLQPSTLSDPSLHGKRLFITDATLVEVSKNTFPIKLGVNFSGIKIDKVVASQRKASTQVEFDMVLSPNDLKPPTEAKLISGHFFHRYDIISQKIHLWQTKEHMIRSLDRYINNEVNGIVLFKQDLATSDHPMALDIKTLCMLRGTASPLKLGTDSSSFSIPKEDLLQLIDQKWSQLTFNNNHQPVLLEKLYFTLFHADKKLPPGVTKEFLHPSIDQSREHWQDFAFDIDSTLASSETRKELVFSFRIEFLCE